jgi:uncharacterized membrane protein
VSQRQRKPPASLAYSTNSANMKPLKLCSAGSICFAGFFTGLMLCFLIAVDPTLAELDAPSYTSVMQRLIQHADHPPLVPMMVVLAIVFPIITLVLLRARTKSIAFLCTGVGLVFMLIALYITIVLNVPLNAAISHWPTHAPPPEWSAIRERWHTLNLYRTPACVLAFLLHIGAALHLADATA